MKDKILKAADIAGLAGINEEEVRRISKEFAKAIPSRNLGRVKIYEEKAAGIISGISDLTKKGLSNDEIMSAIGGIITKKSTKDKVSDKIRKNPASVDNKSKKAVDKVIDTADKAVNQVITKTIPIRNFDSGRYATLDIKLSKITIRLETLEKEMAENKKESDKNIEDLREMILTLDKKMSVTSEWTEYFEKSLDDYKLKQDKVNENFHEWIDYIDNETETLKKPWWKRNKKEREE